MRHRQEICVSVHCVPLHPQIVSRVSHCLNIQQRGLRGVTAPRGCFALKLLLSMVELCGQVHSQELPEAVLISE